MSKLIIRKRVTLEFLGDEYESAWIDFRAIPVGDYNKLMKEIEQAEGEIAATDKILQILKNYYIGGEFPNEEGKLEALDGSSELDGLNPDGVIGCFAKITGQDLLSKEPGIDPKSDTPSKPGLTGANHHPEK